MANDERLGRGEIKTELGRRGIEVFSIAERAAVDLGQSYISSGHLLFSLLIKGDVVLGGNGLDSRHIRANIAHLLNKRIIDHDSDSFTDEIQEVLERAGEHARSTRSSEIGPNDLFWGIVASPNCDAMQYLVGMGIDVSRAKEATGAQVEHKLKLVRVTEN